MIAIAFIEILVTFLYIHVIELIKLIEADIKLNDIVKWHL